MNDAVGNGSRTVDQYTRHRRVMGSAGRRLALSYGYPGCHDAPDPLRGDQTYRRTLWIVLAINAAMFAVEIGAGVAAGSASLQADALDFLGDAVNYAISLFVAGMALRYRAVAALAKGATMGAFGLWVVGVTVWHGWHGNVSAAGVNRLDCRCRRIRD
jgi:hypothetical protein